MAHWRLFYHIVWATRQREPLLDERMAATVERSLRATGHECRAIVHGVGVMPDHVHVAVSIPPSMAISGFVKRLKGSSSHLLNHAAAESDGATFAWQAEYGVYSFGEQALPDVIGYVNNQAAHHANNRLWHGLEVTESPIPIERTGRGAIPSFGKRNSVLSPGRTS